MHSDQIFNKLEFLNEYLMILLAYLMLNFTELPDLPATANNATDLTIEYEPREDHDLVIEFLAIGLIALILLLNLCVMIKLTA